MTTDERLDRLTERHQALAESLQLLTLDVQGVVQSVRELRESTKEVAQSVAGLTQSVKELRELGRDHDRILRGHADLIGDLVKKPPPTNSALIA